MWLKSGINSFEILIQAKFTCFDACHVIWYGGHVIWCDVIVCVVSYHVMQCDVPCNGRVVCSKWFCNDVVIQCTILYYKVLLYTTKHYSSTYNVLLQYYSVLQSTTPLQLCITKYYSNTALYYKVLLQYYSVLQSTTLYCKLLLQYYFILQNATPILPYTTKYYSLTTLYYSNTILQYNKILLQYYSVLQNITPILLCITKYYSNTTLYYKILLQYYSVWQSTTTYYSSITLYCKILLQYSFVLQTTTPVLLCTTKYYSNTTL